MTLPAVPTVTIRFGDGPGFGRSLILGDATDGKLGTNELSTSASSFVTVPDVQDISISRGRDDIFQHYNAGQATIRFLDRNGDWNPNYTAGPYYGKIRPLNKIQITATYNSTTYYLFSGYVESYDYEFEIKPAFPTVTIQAQDGFRLLALNNIETVTGAAAGETTAQRLVEILAEAAWPTSLQDITTGDITVQADPGNTRSGLAACQEMEDAELGAFFMSSDGKATFFSRSALGLKAATATGSRVQFSDAAGAAHPYQILDFTFDDQDLANDVTVTRNGGTAQTAANQSSIDKYYRRTLNRSGILVESDSQALSQANAILNYRDDVQLLIRTVGGDISVSNQATIDSLGLELCDPIYVRKAAAAGPAIEASLLVGSIQHQITPSQWVTTVGTYVPLSTAFILGSTSFGILGTSTL